MSAPLRNSLSDDAPVTGRTARAARFRFFRGLAWPAIKTGCWPAAALPTPTHPRVCQDCGKREPSKSAPPPPQISEYDAYRDAKVKAVAGGAGNTVFNNNERRLPAAGKDEVYYEYYLGIGGDGSAGSHRAVLLVQTGGAKRKLLERYYTLDHYTSFCKMSS